MSDRTDTTAESIAPAAAPADAKGWRLVQRAPQPEAPPERDKAGAQRGMLLILGAGALFWGAVAAGVALLLN